MSEISPARAVAFKVVRRVFEDDAYADRALRSESARLDDRDRALARRLAYGAVQRKRTLDHAIEALGRRPVRKLDPPVVAALRLGAYQVAFMDGVPRYAAVNESVELVRRAGLERAVSFTNAVMRRIAEGARALCEALPDGTTVEAALRHSYPDWIAETWWTELGPDEARALMESQNDEPETAVRLVRGTIEGQPDPTIPGAWVVDRVDEQALAEGRIWPQSRASQLVGLAVGSQPGERTLDLCAAPGGKATMLAGDVDAVEVDEGRADALRNTAAQLGAAHVRVVHADARALPPELSGYDRALVDAPCSGLGVLAARPDLRWRATPLPVLQTELLRAAIERTRAGGTVVYSVCTIDAAESEDVVDAVVGNGAVRVDASLGEEWPQYRHRRRPEFLQTLPHLHGTSGFFVARLTVLRAGLAAAAPDIVLLQPDVLAGERPSAVLVPLERRARRRRHEPLRLAVVLIQLGEPCEHALPERLLVSASAPSGRGEARTRARAAFRTRRPPSRPVRTSRPSPRAAAPRRRRLGRSPG